MTVTNFGTNSNSTVKLWAERTLYDFVSDTQLLGMMIKSGVAQRVDQTSRSAGDRVRVSWLMRLTDPGLLGMASASGQENNLNYYTDDVNIDQLRNVVAIPAAFTIDSQRVLYNLPEDTYRVLSEWMQQRGALGVFNQLAGNTANSIVWDGVTYSGNQTLTITGLNSTVAPSTGTATRQIWANNYTNDQSVGADSTATMTLGLILQAEVIANTAGGSGSGQLMRPLSETSQVKWHAYVHTQCYNDLLNDTSSPNQYRDTHQSLITSGRGEGEILRSFVFSETRIFNSRYIPQGVNSGSGAQVSNSRRNVFCGRDAVGVAFGRGYQEGGEDVAGFLIKSDYVDVGNLQRIAIQGVFGIKKLTFNSNDEGVIVISTYSTI